MRKHARKSIMPASIVALLLFFPILSCTDPSNGDSDDDATSLPPSTIELSVEDMDETVREGTVIGTLSATDPDSESGAIVFHLSAGYGDNALFEINGNALVSAGAIRYSAADHSLEIRVVAVDESNNSSEPVSFTVEVNETIPALYGIWLAGDEPWVFTDTESLLYDNMLTLERIDNTLRRALYWLDQGGTITWVKFEWGENVSYIEYMVETSAETAWADTTANFRAPTVPELMNSDPFAPYSIRHDGSIYDYGPTTTSLDLGHLTVKDIEEGDGCQFTLVSGEADNALFLIGGDSEGAILHINSSVDFSVKNRYEVRIRATDNNGHYSIFGLPVYVRDAYTSGPLELNGTWNCAYGDFAQGNLIVTSSDISFVTDSGDFGGIVLDFDNATDSGIMVWTWHPAQRYEHYYSRFTWTDNGDDTGTFRHQGLQNYATYEEALAADFSDSMTWTLSK